LLLQSISWDLRAGDAAAAKPLIALGKSEANASRTREKLTLLEELTASGSGIPP
jgi:hypothetical protein